MRSKKRKSTLAYLLKETSGAHSELLTKNRVHPDSFNLFLLSSERARRSVLSFSTNGL